MCCRFRRELKRLEEEGRKLVEEELERVNKEVEEELNRRGGTQGGMWNWKMAVPHIRDGMDWKASLLPLANMVI